MRPINVVVGVATFFLAIGFVCLIIRFAFGIVALGKVAIGLFFIAFAVACIPLVFSFVYIVYDRIRGKNNE
jgi:hypothetical protein